MKLSKFNYWLKDYPQKGDYLLFNCRTQGLIRVNQEFRNALEALNGNREVPVLLKEHIPTLKQNGIIVEDDKEEEDKLADFFRQLKDEPCGLSFEVNILTTYNCNFRCVYCFEEEVRQQKYLDKETSGLIVKWLKNYMQKRELKRLYIVYYGGEPLLNTPPIYDISCQLKRWSEKENIEFTFGMITNGSLVSEKLVEELLPLGLSNIRVTVDGVREVHNRMRPFADGSETFDLIIKNVKSVIDKVGVGIAGNFNADTFPAIPQFLDYLREEGLFERLSEINFAAIIPRLGPKDNPSSIELSECLSFVDDEKGMFKETIALKKELKKRGRKVKSDLAVNSCPLFMEAGLTIDPQGIIYKCNSLLGYEEFSVGDVRREGFNANFEKFRDINAWEKCAPDCPYVPMCQGGCRFFSYLENKNFTDLFCRRGYFDRIMPELVKLEYDNLIAGR